MGKLSVQAIVKETGIDFGRVHRLNIFTGGSTLETMRLAKIAKEFDIDSEKICKLLSKGYTIIGALE